MQNQQGPDEAKELREELASAREEISRLRSRNDKLNTLVPKWPSAPSYSADFLMTWNKSVDFLTDERFMSAYKRGMDSGHTIGRPLDSDIDIHIEWRIHVCCWAAYHAQHLPGDFVECGTNTGIMSLAVCDYLDFNSLNKKFWLFDTFSGIPEHQVSSKETELGRLNENDMYPECFERAQKNFSHFPNANLIRGEVPGTLRKVEIEQVAYLCIDMNISLPEQAAFSHFWPRMVSGGIIVFDDYGWSAYREQKDYHDAFAKKMGVEILLLPTGQGLLIKP